MVRTVRPCALEPDSGEGRKVRKVSRPKEQEACDKCARIRPRASRILKFPKQ